MAYDLISKIDITSSVDPLAVQDAMSRIRGFMLREWPDLDTSPSSPFGNLVLQPLSKCLVLIERTLECVLSDVQLENALNGIVCDCNFIQEFLKGLGVTTLAEANCTGWARWHFVEDPKDILIDRGVNMLFAGNIFHIYAPFDTPINLLSTGESKPDSVKNYARVFYSSNQWTDGQLSYIDANDQPATTDSREPNEWYIDLPIYGPSTAELTAGTLAEIDEDLPYFDLVRSVELLNDIAPFEVPTDLASLIKLVRTIQPSSNITTRGNASSYTLQKFPSVTGVSAVIAGDKEMSVRSSSVAENIQIYAAPFMDLFVKGVSSEPETISLAIPLTYEDEGGNLKIKFESDVFYPGHEILSIGKLYYGDETSAFTIYDEQSNIVGLDKYIEFTPNSDGMSYGIKFNGNLLCKKDDEEGDPSNTLIPPEDTAFPGWKTASKPLYFRLEVQIDRLPSTVATAIQSPDVSPALNVLARPFVVCSVQNLSVSYRKDTGKFFDRQQAISQIYDLVNSLTYPTHYSDAYIGDIIMANGAAGVGKVSVNAKLRNNMVDTKASYVPFTSMTVYTLNAEDMNMPHIGPRNIQYILPRENINLIERP